MEDFFFKYRATKAKKVPCGQNWYMLISMTGYGRAARNFNAKLISVELRTLNGKQLDLNVRLPQEYREKEMVIRKLISKTLLRGKVDMYIAVELLGENGGAAINKDLVSNYIRTLQEVSGDLDISTGDILATAMRLPNSTAPVKEELTEEEWELLQELVLEATEQCHQFRTQEGSSLETDIKLRIENILEERKEVEILAGRRIEVIRARLLQSLEEISQKIGINQDRYEQEVIYYLEKLDITEEIVRLRSHCEHFLAALENNTHSIGKKLGFIGQEIGRELNTIGAKANDADIQMKVVHMKDQLEKVKEQLMNIL